MRNYKHLIFDLDDTLFDTWGLLVKNALNEACQKMIDSGLNANLEEAVAFREELYKTNPRCKFWVEISEKFGTNNGKTKAELSEIGDRAFHKRNVAEKIYLFKGAEEMLSAMQHTFTLHLVTSGNLDTQNQKIKQLDIQDYFKNIYCVDPLEGQSKLDAFKKIVKCSEESPEDILCIGNRLDQEIQMGKTIGFDTCYVRHGEYIHMQPSCPEEHPDYTIENVTELIHILEMDDNLLEELKRA